MDIWLRVGTVWCNPPLPTPHPPGNSAEEATADDQYKGVYINPDVELHYLRAAIGAVTRAYRNYWLIWQ